MRMRLIRLAISSIFVAVPTLVAVAEEKPAVKSPDEVQTLTVHPRAIERPLLKYRLFPAEYELKDGNAAPILLRLPWEQIPYFTNVVPTFGDYLELPLDDPRVLGSGNVFQQYGQLKRAAYMRTADWEYPIGEVPLADILLPDVQGARAIVGRGLSVRIRHRIATGKLDEAREGILVGFALSRHYGRTPFLITQLVCAAIDSMMLDRIEELISQADCPNLYWSLTSLPRPFIDVHPATEIEQQMLAGTVPGLDRLDAMQTQEEWDAKALAIFNLFETEGRNSQPVDDNQRLSRVAGWARARRTEWAETHIARLSEMSDSEVAVRWLLFLYQDYTQEISSIMVLEPRVAIPRLRKLERELSDAESTLGIPSLFVMKSPLQVYRNIRHIERRIDALRVVEAIRHYAATHEGRLPESLDQIDETPVPDDPFTGEPFHYELEDGAAMLWAEGISVDGKEVGAIHYRLVLQQAAD